MEEAAEETFAEEVVMMHSEIQCVFSEGEPVQVAKAVLHFVEKESLFE
jgi:hypothetical protein